MAFLRGCRDVSITTTAPSSISSDLLLRSLHDHERMMKLSSIVTRLAPTEPGDASVVKARDAEPEFAQAPWHWIEEVVPVVGKIRFLAAFKDQPDGLDSVVHAPLGLVMHVSWRVDRDAHGRVLLREANRMEVNRALEWFIMTTFDKVHRQMHRDLYKQLEDEQGGRTSE